MEKCEECGCLQLSHLWHSFAVHYKKCSHNKDYFGRKRKVPQKAWEKRLKNYVEVCKKNVDYAKEELKEARDCVKNTCLDEVYECRWDGRSVPEGVWLKNAA